MRTTLPIFLLVLLLGCAAQRPIACDADASSATTTSSTVDALATVLRVVVGVAAITALTAPPPLPPPVYIPPAPLQSPQTVIVLPPDGMRPAEWGFPSQ